MIRRKHFVDAFSIIEQTGENVNFLLPFAIHHLPFTICHSPFAISHFLFLTPRNNWPGPAVDLQIDPPGSIEDDAFRFQQRPLQATVIP